MVTKVDNLLRKYYIVEIGWSSSGYVCNLTGIPEVIKEIGDKEPYRIYYIFNHELQSISKKKLNEMFEANKMKFRIK